MIRPAGSRRKEARRRGEPSATRKMRVCGVSAKNSPEAAKEVPLQQLLPTTGVSSRSRRCAELAKARGYCPVIKKTHLASLGFTAKCRVPALLIPIHDVAGEIRAPSCSASAGTTERKGGA
jgi:hypothetical protein